MASFQHTLTELFNIRQGEGRPLALLLIHSFLLGLTTVFYDTGASALFLAEFDAEMLPYVYLGSAVVVTIVGVVYSKFETSTSLSRLLTGNLFFLILSVVLFRVLLASTGSKWPIMVVFIWLEVLAVLTSLEFGSLAGQLFNVRQGKRLFGLIGAGEVCAAIIGGLVAAGIVPLVGVANLLLFSAAALAGCLIIMRHIVASFPEAMNQMEEEQDREPEEYAGIKELLKDKYLSLIMAISAISVLGYYFIDFAFYQQAESRWHDPAGLARFFGLYLAGSGFLSLMARGFLSGRLLSRYGLNFGLLALPAMLILGSGAASITGLVWTGAGLFFWLIVMTKLFDEVIRTSVEEPSILLSYQPLSRKQRVGIQTIVESIVEPVAGGLAGGILLLLTFSLDFTALQAAVIMTVLPVFWMIIAWILSREYIATLIKALKKRSLGELAFNLNDPRSLEILKRGLKSPHPGEVIYSLNILEEIEHDTLNDELFGLIDHPSPIIRKEALKRIAGLKTVSRLSDLIKRLKQEEDPSVKGLLLKTLCELSETDVLDEILPFLKDDHREIKKGAMVGLLQNGGIEGILAAGEYFTELVDSRDPRDRRFAAEILGEIQVQGFYRPLIGLMQDEEAEVKRAALKAAGRIVNPKLLPLVIENIAVRDTCSAACSALVNAGEQALAELQKSFSLENQRYEVRLRIVKIIGRIKDQGALQFLVKNIDFPDLYIRHQILQSLSAWGFRADSDQEGAIRKRIVEEVQNAAWTLYVMTKLETDGDFGLLARSLGYDYNRTVDRLFLLLSLVFPSGPILRAQANLTDPSMEKKAYALETLDNLLPQDLRRLVLPLIDDLQPEQRLKSLSTVLPHQTMDGSQGLFEILARPPEWSSPWSKTCALYILGRTGDQKFTDMVSSGLNDDHAMVRETAVWAVGAIKPTDLTARLSGLINDQCPEVAELCRSIIDSRQNRGRERD